jgi:exodeoxyribonuclease-3
MKIATWNVNSLKVRLPQVVAWLQTHQPDALCLQETKTEDASFPAAEIAEAGYKAVFTGQKTYNGVAILSKVDATDAVMSIPDFEDPQKRVLAATINGVRVVCLYVPNGQSVGSDKYQYKLAWLQATTAWLKNELAANPRMVVVGDFNIAPADIDVHDPKAWAGQVLCSDAEREALRQLLAIGLKDGLRLIEPEAQLFTWWDYRMNAFKRKMGLRIDHVLVSEALAAKCSACSVDLEPRRHERPSDHAPVTAEFADQALP